MQIISLIPHLRRFAYILLRRPRDDDELIDNDVKEMEKEYKKEHRKPCKICGSYECDGDCMDAPK